MSNSGSGQGDVFDVLKIRRLVELMNDHELAEIDLRQADQRIRLRRTTEPPTLAIGPPPPTVAAPTPQPADPSQRLAPDSEAESSDDSAQATSIKSPMVGTFYRSSSPEAAPFVNIGDRVSPESPVCIVEAMKVFNEIPAECSGQITAILIENGDPVEYGQPLFEVDTGS